MRIVVDLDATVVNIHDPWYSAYAKRSVHNLSVEDVTTWDIANHVSPENFQHAMAVLREPGFFTMLPPLPGAIEAVRELCAHHDVRVISAAEFPGNFTEKALWVREYMPWLTKRQFGLLHDKHWIRADALVDDKPATAEAFAQENKGSLVLGIKFPYNANCKAYTLLADDWQNTEKAWQSILTRIGR